MSDDKRAPGISARAGAAGGLSITAGLATTAGTVLGTSFLSIGDFEEARAKKAGFSEGFIGRRTTDIVGEYVYYMIKPGYKTIPAKRSSREGAIRITETQDAIREYTSAGIYDIIIPERAPRISLVRGKTDSEKFYLSSRFFENVQDLSQFTGAEISSQFVADSPKVAKIKGWESVLPACIIAGDKDYHAGNLMVDQDGNLKKIDHGKSSTMSFDNPEKLFADTRTRLDIFGFGSVEMDMRLFAQNLIDMSGSLTDEKNEQSAKARVSDLKKIGLSVENLTLAYNKSFNGGYVDKITTFDELETSLIKAAKQQRDTSKALGELFKEQMNTISELIDEDLPSKLTIRDLDDPIGLALRHNLKIEGKSALEYAKECTDDKMVQEFVYNQVISNSKIDGKNPLEWLKNNFFIHTRSKETIVKNILNKALQHSSVSIKTMGEHPLVWMSNSIYKDMLPIYMENLYIHRKTIDGLDLFAWATLMDIKLGGKLAVEYAKDEDVIGFKDNPDALIKAAITYDRKIDGKDPIEYALENELDIPLIFIIKNDKTQYFEQVLESYASLKPNSPLKAELEEAHTVFGKDKAGEKGKYLDEKSALGKILLSGNPKTIARFLETKSGFADKVTAERDGQPQQTLTPAHLMQFCSLEIQSTMLGVAGIERKSGIKGKVSDAMNKMANSFNKLKGKGVSEKDFANALSELEVLKRQTPAEISIGEEAGVGKFTKMVTGRSGDAPVRGK